jgi:hypothetical protein
MTPGVLSFLKMRCIMYGDLDTLELYWKELEHELVAADKRVYHGPCFLYAAQLVSNTSGASTAVIRDGQNTDAEVVVDLAALTSSNDPRRWDPPIYLKKGLFVDVGTNVTSVLVHYRPAKGKKE